MDSTKVSFLSPIGEIEIYSNENYILKILIKKKVNKLSKNKENKIPLILIKAKKQLKEYFEGKRKVFTIPIKLQGTDFQKKVWKALLNIPYGETKSYKDIAIAIGNPKAARSVGSAIKNNKIAIVVPCHRVINSNGNLGGYASGIENKKYLLELEKNIKKN